MSIIIRHIYRNIRENKLSGLLIVISLALSSAVFYLNLNIKDDMLNITKSLFDGANGGYDIYLSDPSGELLASDYYVPDKGMETLPVRYDGGIYVSGKNENITARLICTDVGTAVLHNLVHLNGENDDFNLNVGEAVISEKKASYFGITVGQDITVSTQDGDKTYKIAAIAESIGIFTRETKDTIEIITEAYTGDLVSGWFIDTGTNKNTDTDAYTDSLEIKYSSLTVDALYESGNAEARTESVKSILYLIIAVAVSISFYVISSVTTLLLDARTPTIGTFRSVGATGFMMNSILVVENVIYGLIGGCAGILIGGLLRKLLTSIYYKSDASGIINMRYIIICFGFTVILQLIISLASVIRASGYSIKDIMFKTTASVSEISYAAAFSGAVFFIAAVIIYYNNNEFDYIRNIIALLLSILGATLMIPLIIICVSLLLSAPIQRILGGPFYLGMKNMSVSSIDRSSVILTAIVTALAFVVYLCSASVGIFYEKYEDNYPYDIFIKGLAHTSDEYDFLCEIDGISIIDEHWDFRKAEVNGAQEKRCCFVCREGYSNGITVDSALLDNLGDGHVIVDSMYAAKRNIKTGDTIEIKNENSVFLFRATVDGVCDSSIFNSKRTSIIMTENDYFNYIEKSPSLLGVTITDGADIADVISELEASIYEHTGESVTATSKEAYVTKEVESARDALKIFSVVPVLVTTLSVLGLVNNQIISFNRKRKEYAVLYSVAMSRTQIGKMIFSELIYIYLTGSLIGMLLSFWLVDIVRDIFFGLIAYIEIDINYIGMLLIMLCALLLLGMTGVIPLRHAAKMNIVEEIKYE